MPNIEDVVSLKLECAKSEIHNTYTAALRTLGAESFFCQEDRKLLAAIDRRLLDLSKHRKSELDHLWKQLA